MVVLVLCPFVFLCNRCFSSLLFVFLLLFFSAVDSVEDDTDISADTWDILNGACQPTPGSSLHAKNLSSSSSSSVYLPSSSSVHRQPHQQPSQTASLSLSLNFRDVPNSSISFSASQKKLGERPGVSPSHHPLSHQTSPGVILKKSSSSSSASSASSSISSSSSHIPPHPSASLSLSSPAKHFPSSSSSAGMLKGGLVTAQEAKKNGETKKGGGVSSLLASGDNFFDEMEKQLMSDDF